MLDTWGSFGGLWEVFGVQLEGHLTEIVRKNKQVSKHRNIYGNTKNRPSLRFLRFSLVVLDLFGFSLGFYKERISANASQKPLEDL